MKKMLGLFLLCISIGCNVSHHSANTTATPSPSKPTPIIPTVPGQPGVTVTKQEFDDKWAFSVDEGKLNCIGQKKIGEASFTANGKNYALNGVAKSTKKYSAIDEIWLSDPKIPGAKISLEPFIDKALELCK